MGNVGGVITNMGETVWVRDMLYKEVVQLVFFYRSKSWFMMGVML